MNFKRWFAWACLALVVVAEVALFRAYRQQDALQIALRETQVQLNTATTELDDLKNSNAGLQATEISRLRRQNEILTNQIAHWREMAEQFSSQSQTNSLRLATARAALRLQQTHLQELRDENQEIVDAGAAIIARKTCLSYLRLIDDAKQQWALDTGKPPTTVPTAKDLQNYFKDNALPECPSGGTYSLNALNEVPTCSLPGHTLP